MYLADPSLGSIRCHSCIADSNIPRKCTRDEFQGVFIKCPVDNSPVNTCYKSVHRVTGGEDSSYKQDHFLLTCTKT